MIRNCRYINKEQTAVDCEIDHTVHGWIPTTVLLDGSDDRLTIVEIVKESDIAPFVEPELTKEQRILVIEREIQALHDKAAQVSGYDNINSCAKYIGYDNPFRAECEALCGWAAQCWAKCYELIDQVERGDIAEPTIEEAISMMPELSL